MTALANMNWIDQSLELCKMCNDDARTLLNMREIIVPRLLELGDDEHLAAVATFNARFPA
jgi:hypothetical protein